MNLSTCLGWSTASLINYFFYRFGNCTGQSVIFWVKLLHLRERAWLGMLMCASELCPVLPDSEGVCSAFLTRYGAAQ